MPDPKLLKDLRGRTLYMGYGDYRSQVEQLSFRQGWRGTLLNVYLKAQYFLPFKNSPLKPPFQSVAQNLLNAAPSPIISGLFYDTSWYKETKSIGIVRTAETEYFVKIYTLPEECLFEERQAKFVADMFSGSFIVAPIMHSKGNCLFYKSIKHLRPVGAEDHIEERLLHITKDFIDRHAVTKNLSESIPLGLFAFCHGTEYAGLAQKIRTWIEKNERGISHIPVHGDMTSWNMFVNTEEKIVLVDYERSGWHVPFYDLFHYVLQPQALKKNKNALQNILYRKTWYHRDIMKVLLTLYIIDQFYLDLSDHKIRGFDNIPLRNSIATKAAWLEKLLDD